MKKNDCVSVNTKLAAMIEEYCQSEKVDNSAAAFARKVGQYNRWVSDLKRGRNKIKKEVAVRVCLLLQTTPEEILLHSGPTEEKTQKCLEDIEEVKRLIEEERGRNVEKAPADKSGSQSEEEFMMLFQQLSPEEQANEIAYLRERIAREAAKGK